MPKLKDLHTYDYYNSRLSSDWSWFQREHKFSRLSMDVTLSQEHIVQSHGSCTIGIPVGEKWEGQILDIEILFGVTEYCYIKVSICHKRQNLFDRKCPMEHIWTKSNQPLERLDVTPLELASEEKGTSRFGEVNKRFAKDAQA
jgi:hypothetical protein